MPRDEIEKTSVIGIQDAPRVDARNQKPGRSWLSWRRQRQHESRLHRIRPRAGAKHALTAGEIEYLAALSNLRHPPQRPRFAPSISVEDGMVLRERHRILGQSRARDTACARSVRVQEVD